MIESHLTSTVPPRPTSRQVDGVTAYFRRDSIVEHSGASLERVKSRRGRIAQSGCRLATWRKKQGCPSSSIMVLGAIEPSVYSATPWHLMLCLHPGVPNAASGLVVHMRTARRFNTKAAAHSLRVKVECAESTVGRERMPEQRKVDRGHHRVLFGRGCYS